MKYLLCIAMIFGVDQMCFSQLVLFHQGQPVSSGTKFVYKKGQTLRIIAQLTTNDIDMDDIDRVPEVGDWVDSTTMGGNMIIETLEWVVTSDTFFDFFDGNNMNNVLFTIEVDGIESLVLDVVGSTKISIADTLLDEQESVVRIADELLGVRKYQVGDFAQGGVIFSVDASGEHGLVCAKNDQSAGIKWSAGSVGNTPARGDGPGAGAMNTIIIITSQAALGDNGDTTAARLCNELQIFEGGISYGDWYLPSKDELNLMYLNKAIIDSTATANGGSIFSLDNLSKNNQNDLIARTFAPVSLSVVVCKPVSNRCRQALVLLISVELQ